MTKLKVRVVTATKSTLVKDYDNIYSNLGLVTRLPLQRESKVWGNL